MRDVGAVDGLALADAIASPGPSWPPVRAGADWEAQTASMPPPARTRHHKLDAARRESRRTRDDRRPAGQTRRQLSTRLTRHGSAVAMEEETLGVPGEAPPLDDLLPWFSESVRNVASRLSGSVTVWQIADALLVKGIRNTAARGATAGRAPRRDSGSRAGSRSTGSLYDQDAVRYARRGNRRRLTLLGLARLDD